MLPFNEISCIMTIGLLVYQFCASMAMSDFRSGYCVVGI